MTDPERLQRLLFPESEEDWEEARAENDAAPREPGRYKIVFPNAPRPMEPWSGVCPDCGRTVSSRGGGVSFEDIPCPLHTGDCLVMHIHWSEDCPGLRHRW